MSQFRVERVWQNFGATNALAVRSNHFVRFPAYRKPFLLSRSFEDATETIWEIEKPFGERLSQLKGNEVDIAQGYGIVPFAVVARGSRIYIYDEVGLYELL